MNLSSSLTSTTQSLLVYLTVLNLLFCELQESAMKDCRQIDPVEQERLISLYYIIEMKFLIQKIIYHFEIERCTTLRSLE